MGPVELQPLPSVPEEQRAIRTSTGKQTFVDGMPGHSCGHKKAFRQAYALQDGRSCSSLTCGLLLVSSEDLQLLLQVPDVKEFAEVVARGRQQPVPVQVPLHLHHRVLVGVSA